MTPVQLPEVPAPSAWAITDYQPEANTQFTMRVDAAEHYASVGLQVEPLYTADQLRAYATDYSAPFVDELRHLYRAYVSLLESGRDRITDLGGSCDPVDVMERNDPYLIQARRTLALLTQPEQNSGR